MNTVKLERKFLSAIINTDIMHKLLTDERINENLFSEIINKNIFNFLMKFYNKANLIPNCDLFLSYVKNRIKSVNNKKMKLEDLYEKYEILIRKLYEDEIDSEEVIHIIDELYENYKLRTIQKFVVNLYDTIDNGEIDLAYENVDKFVAKQFIINNECDYINYFENQLERAKEIRKDHSVDYIPINLSGYNPTNYFNGDKVDFNLFLQGGFYNGELIIFIGDSGSGKSLTLMEVAYGASLNGKNVFFATIEMSHKKQALRLDSRISGVPFTKFRTGTITKKEMQRWVNRVNKYRFTNNIGNVFIYEFPKGCTVIDIERKMKEIEIKRKLKIDILVVDYLNDMKTVGSSSFIDDKDWKTQGSVSWDLKGLASQRKIPVVTASQSKPGAIDGKVIVKDNKVYFRRMKWDSSAFSKLPSYHATLIISILSSKFIDNGIADMLNFQVIKARDGETSLGIVTFPNYTICKINTDNKKYREAVDRSKQQVVDNYENIEEEI